MKTSKIKINHAAIRRIKAQRNGGRPKQAKREQQTLTKNEMNCVRRGYANRNADHAHTTRWYAVGAEIGESGKPLYDTMRQRGYKWLSK